MHRPSQPPITLTGLPAEIFYLVLADLYNPSVLAGRYDHEVSKGRFLLPLSETCRYLRAQTLPWIFREVYNWDRPDGAVWPANLFPLFRTVHIRDRSVRKPGIILLSSAMYHTLPNMPSLTHVTVRLVSPIPAGLLHALSLVPQLTSLEIHQARFDGNADYSYRSFARLESLSICIAGFEGAVRSNDINRVHETRNVVIFLKNVSDRLVAFQISGDLLSPEFIALCWPKLQKFTISEHTPTPFIPVPDLVSQMPALRELSVLYTADLSRDRNAGAGYPPFRLGIARGKLLTICSPLLASVTLSNMDPMDPIFAQLPPTLPSLHLWALVDGYLPVQGAPSRLWEAPLTNSTALTALENLAHLKNLTQLSLTLDTFVDPVLIHRIATVFPGLEFLELGNSSYLYEPPPQADVRDPNILDALQRFPLLADLNISLNFGDIRLDRQGPLRRAARWLLEGLPNLRTVGFSWEQNWWYSGFDMLVWQKWDRSVLLRPPSPPAPPRMPPLPLMEVDGIPPWEMHYI